MLRATLCLIILCGEAILAGATRVILRTADQDFLRGPVSCFLYRRPSALSLGHGVSRESVPAAGLGRRIYNGNAAAGRDSVGRMDTPLLLEDRMR